MKDKLLERLRVRIPEEQDDGLLAAMLEEAEGYILAYTARPAMPEVLRTTQLQLAVIYYNRLNVEGESARTEGGVQRTFDSVPKQIEDALRPYRLAKVGW